MRLVQFKDTAGAQHVAVVEDENTLIPLKGVSTTRELCDHRARQGHDDDRESQVAYGRHHCRL